MELEFDKDKANYDHIPEASEWGDGEDSDF